MVPEVPCHIMTNALRFITPLYGASLVFSQLLLLLAGKPNWISPRTLRSLRLSEVYLVLKEENAALVFELLGVPIEIGEYAEHGRDAHATVGCRNRWRR